MLLRLGNLVVNLDDVETFIRRDYTEDGQKAGEVIEISLLSRPGKMDHVRDPDGNLWRDLIDKAAGHGLVQVNSRYVVQARAVSLMRVVPVEDTGGTALEIRFRSRSVSSAYQRQEDGVDFDAILQRFMAAQ